MCVKAPSIVKARAGGSLVDSKFVGLRLEFRGQLLPEVFRSGCKQVSCSHHFQPGSLVVALGVFARESGWCGGEDCVSRLQQFSGGRNIGAHGLAHFHLTQSRLPPQNTHSTSNKRISFESRFALLSFVVPEHHHVQTLWQWSLSIQPHNESRNSVVVPPAAEPHLWIVYPSANVFSLRIVESILSSYTLPQASSSHKTLTKHLPESLSERNAIRYINSRSF
jgi:hypothetical protein